MLVRPLTIKNDVFIIDNNDVPGHGELRMSQGASLVSAPTGPEHLCEAGHKQSARQR